MSGVPTIWFVRHGQTDWNAEGRLQGHRDTDLNANGLAHAAEAAARLRRIAGAELPTADYVASPLTRTRRTMEILRTGIGLPAGGYRADMRLREIGFGAWEGRTWAEIRRRDPAGAAARDRDRWGYQPRGGGGGELRDGRGAGGGSGGRATAPDRDGRPWRRRPGAAGRRRPSRHLRRPAAWHPPGQHSRHRTRRLALGLRDYFRGTALEGPCGPVERFP
ncbi:hypothetical protein M2440_002324 [Methylorubrum extorquens]|nr:hypothetical protein [Methylorubrum extorquens]